MNQSKANPFYQFRDEKPDKFLGSPIFSTNIKQFNHNQLVKQASGSELKARVPPNVKLAPLKTEKDASGNDQNLKRSQSYKSQYCFRLRDPSRDIQPEMRFSLNCYIRAKKAAENKENKSRRTFLAALQTFYNKLALTQKITTPKTSNPEGHEEKVLLRKKSSFPEDLDQQIETDERKKEEAALYLSDVARTVLTKYKFFPRKSVDFLKQGNGKTCANPLVPTKDVYNLVLR